MAIRLLALVGLCACGSESGIQSALPNFEPSNLPPMVDGTIQEDRIFQVTIPVVDVLFVVDNSCSMEEEQVALAENFPSFLDWFLGSGLDYHIGVISTDMEDPQHTGRLQPGGGELWVDAKTKTPDVAFAQMVSLGIEGDPNEKGRAAAYTALNILAKTDNKGFLREDSGVHITVVSDEDDVSGRSPVSRSEFIAYLQDLRFGNKVSFSSIVGPITGCPDIGTPGTDYMAVTGQVGGVIWPICEPKWTQILDDLGFLAVGLSKEFFLSQIPVVETIEVSVDTNGAIRRFGNDEWVYTGSRNSITFVDFVPEPLSAVSIRYEVLASQAGSLEDPES